MENGTLEKKLRADNPSSALSGKARLQISRGREFFQINLQLKKTVKTKHQASQTG